MLWRLIPLLVLALLSFSTTFAQSDDNPLTDERFAQLARGVNITRWFWLEESTSEEHYRNYVTDEQLAEIRARGFLHVRLVIDPAYLFELENRRNLDPRKLGYLDHVIERIVAQDLAVIVDMHNWLDSFGLRVIEEPYYAEAFGEMWNTLAAHLDETTDPERVFLEVMNEPSPTDDAWIPIQEQLVAQIRDGAPQHTIIVGGPGWNSIDGLRMIRPFDDPNIVYNFHFYEPFIFTHQGAEWIEDVAPLRNIPYPSVGRCNAMPNFGNADLNGWVAHYCNSDLWDVGRIERRIGQARDWAAVHGVRLTANEFGVLPHYAPRIDRLRWIRDARVTFESYGIGWTIWGYDDDFGLGYNTLGEMDAGVMTALGL
jgi:endoglucanase